MLAFVGESSEASRTIDADRLCRRFPQLTRRAAALHLVRLARYGLIAATRPGPAWSVPYRITARGRGRIRWHQLGAAPPVDAVPGLRRIAQQRGVSAVWRRPRGRPLVVQPFGERGDAHGG